jgi:hypothetical protein
MLAKDRLSGIFEVFDYWFRARFKLNAGDFEEEL